MNRNSLGIRSKAFLVRLKKGSLVNNPIVWALVGALLCFFHVSILMAVKDARPPASELTGDLYDNVYAPSVKRSEKVVRPLLSFESTTNFHVSEFRKRVRNMSLEERASCLGPLATLLVHENVTLRRKIPALLSRLLDGQSENIWHDFFSKLYPLLGHSDEKRRESVYIFICRLLKNEAARSWMHLFDQLLYSSNEHVKEYGMRLKHRFRAISGKDGKRLLSVIKQDVPSSQNQCFPRKMELPWNVSSEELNKVWQRYQKIKSELGDKETDVSKQVYTTLLKEKYPDFAWPKEIEFDSLPQVYGQPLSIASFLLLDLQEDLYKYESESLLRTLLKELQAVTPDRQTMAQLCHWLNKGKKGQSLTILSTVCPDYSHTKVRGVNRYTFESLGGGIGLVAQHILEVLPLLFDFFNFHNVHVTIKLALADTEVLDKKNVQKLGLTTSEFMGQVKKSKLAIENALGDLPVEVVMLSDLCGGLENWAKTLNTYRDLLDRDDLGGLKLRAKDLEDVLNVRRKLYQRWHGKHDDDFYLRCLKDQGAEYITAGEIIGLSQENCMILGVDHSSMHPFYSASPVVQNNIPILYRLPHYE